MKIFLLFSFCLVLNFFFINQTMAEGATCFDSDGEVNIFEKGYVSGIDNGGKNYFIEDYCAPDIPDRPTMHTVVEQYCGPEGTSGGPRNTTKLCPGGGSCKDGACVEIRKNLSILDADGPNFPLGIKYEGTVDLYDNFVTKLIVRENNENGSIICDLESNYHIVSLDMGPKPAKDGEIIKGKMGIPGCPSITTDRKFYIKVIVDAGDWIKETNENDNILEKIIGQDSGAVDLSKIKPDLLIKPNSLKVNDNDRDRGGFNYIVFDFVNNSERKIIDIKYKIKTEIFSESIVGNKIYEKIIETSDLNGCDNAKGFFPDSGKNIFSNGKKYTVKITLDSDNNIDESNENNNTVSLNFIFNPSTSNNSVVNDEYIVIENKKVDINLINKLKGKILLQVESVGEAWYIDPLNNQKYSLGRPDEAFKVMRERGVGITNIDLNKIPVAIDSLNSLGDVDSDGDAFPDKLELEKGYNPNGAGKIKIDNVFASKQVGKIFLQVQSRGEAWYVNPDNNKRYYLGRPQDAFNIMRSLSLGISNNDFNNLY